ncbi:hypothetical protein K0M31_010883 [Melipona bicolor]|uniref:Uncharacterized protein n=1 Tax=Melipona bicolor TaxID=60889 RepID=A0AA40FL31_9HYME|nr:hypothetical protein K0M31_010883 [Melipona bicolor]
MAAEKMRSMRQEGRKVDTVEERVQQARLAPSTGPRSVIGPFQQDPWDDFKQTSSPCKLLAAVILFYRHRLHGFTYMRTRRKRSSTFFGPLAVARFDYGVSTGFSTFMEHLFSSSTPEIIYQAISVQEHVDSCLSVE